MTGKSPEYSPGEHPLIARLLSADREHMQLKRELDSSGVKDVIGQVVVKHGGITEDFQDSQGWRIADWSPMAGISQVDLVFCKRVRQDDGEYRSVVRVIYTPDRILRVQGSKGIEEEFPVEGVMGDDTKLQLGQALNRVFTSPDRFFMPDLPRLQSSQSHAEEIIRPIQPLFRPGDFSR